MTGYAQRVLDELEYQGLKKSDLVNNLGIPDSTVRGWWAKDTIPAADTALKVARFLNVSLEYLITGEEREPRKESTIHDFVTDEEYNYLYKYRVLPDHDKIMMKKIIDAAYESLSSKNEKNQILSIS
ncbi:MAG: helix-turn-helix domain-containing protein [Treponema sp.]|nr:helix-turn-helix domain-containing protein [Candidatus Treponema merdequi]